MSQIQQIIAGLDKIPHNKQLLSFVTTDPKERIDSDYYFDPASGRFYARVVFGLKAQGPPGHAHGGAIASLLDESMGATAWMNKYMTMTAELKVNYKRAVPLQQEFYIQSWVAGTEGKKIYLQSDLMDASGKIFATGEGLFISQPLERFKEMGVESLEPPFSVA